ncbi:hypothetical protein HZ992_15245 [Rhizobacter sp. AJA081-3]|uniref:hypothetical protein n=1 Tax=Rhizobacter sp. AJA081-3 TaxID=2753607 RepID=UPI001AE07C05|nr:hypothetical protein [Rhizobacter sp. AJA081-3]QTN21536.1 hypothetical protein HZ992_15245 [Rhizobacter sp. AJA081-3]
MAAFETLDWGNLDVFAILVGDGVATIEPSFAHRSLGWLRSHSYEIAPLDFSGGIGPIVARLGELFQWEQQFGYKLTPDDRNLARLNDGFWYEIPERGGLVLELRELEAAFAEDADWSAGFLRIISEHSRRQLALGRRFFAVAHVSSGESPIVGCSLGERSVPYPYPFPQRNDA